ncbi:uncharacterized protein METZ01_LOCUS480363, partial [marine metagenome]
IEFPRQKRPRKNDHRANQSLSLEAPISKQPKQQPMTNTFTHRMKLRPYLRNKFSLAGALALVSALVLALPRLEAVNVPIEEAMTMVGGHVTVNDDDANANEEWDKDDTGSLPNTNPKLREFIINIKQTGRPGELTIYDSGLTIGGVVHAKLWKDANKTAPFELKWPVNGNVVESFPLWVEGIQSTEKIDSLELKVIYEPYELDGKAEASVKFGVFQADLDIDSNNDDGLSASGYDDAEDKVE